MCTCERIHMFICRYTYKQVSVCLYIYGHVCIQVRKNLSLGSSSGDNTLRQCFFLIDLEFIEKAILPEQ